MVSVDDYIVDVLMRDLVAHDRRPVAFFAYLWLVKEQQQQHGRPVRVSYRDMAESIGVSKSSAQTAISWLVRRRLLAVTKENSTAIPCYTVLRPWKS